VGETAHGIIPHFDCESYIYGVLDSFLAFSDFLPPHRRTCAPEELAPWMVYEHLMAADIQGLREDPAASVITDILHHTFPCD